MGNDIEQENIKPILEKKFENKMNDIIKDLDNKLDNIKKELMNYFEKNIKDIILKEISQLKTGKININLESNKENEKNAPNQEKKINKNNKEKEIKDEKLSDFITICKKDELKPIYFEPKEIDEENERITRNINDKVYEDYLPEPEKESVLNETAGKFFYAVGGISRISQSMANKVYYELFEEYKKFLKLNKDWLTYNHEQDRKNLSIWTKNCLMEKKFYEFYSNKNIQEINKYLYKDDENTNKTLLELFKNLIDLYTKCRLSYPTIVKAEYTNNNCEFSSKTMIDCLLKYEKNKKVNFCYFPALISNGKFLRNGNYYVLTYSLKNKTFHIDGNIYDYKMSDQIPKLYIIPDPNNLKIKISHIGTGKKKKIKINVEPLLSSELNNLFILYRSGSQKYYKIDENDNGIFEIDIGNYYVKIKYAKDQEKIYGFIIK